MNFNELCYQIIKSIPKGKVVTYKDIALVIGKKSYRAVGNAMNKNHYDKNIYPCHRVIKSSGLVGGYALGTKAKIKKLKSEGIEIINGKINLKEFGFKLNHLNSSL